MLSIDQIFPLLSQPRNVVITTHQKPDGDAMGSSLGLYHFLKQFGHTVTVISPTNWASFLNWMPDSKLVLDYEAQTDKANAAIDNADWIFCLDFNTLIRTKRMEEKLTNSNAVRILIDHHQEPQVDKFTYGDSNTSKSSTCEMVYDFIVNSGNEDKINEQVAECLYAGVMTDTGSFRFPSTSANVHRMVAVLKDKGLQHSKVHEELFDNFLENKFKFIGNVLLHRMEIFYEYNTALIAVPQSDLIKYNIKTGDTEGLVNYPLSIQGIRLAAIIIDRGDERKCSFRSKGEFDVNLFARKYFNGGGHINAAGGQSSEPLDAVVAKFKTAMIENKNQLSNYQF
ncbi:bifunctional oligoribonuclease/PAP phosphatase NrnA [Ferruginibacter lapsinanis]|uniref:DHH family phosphoesterase n=1 Tax=Ferruginibacter lapsinanis TaxID=563172 RepID=UPI001E39C538|nr:bifunctional oligoribonuclease/PAP phosphatase NrnA [Ferruginibacter lapsinanis]UEG49395.1 bifunctional oligoribonuclease/PAP phosphatase NrnA [Ferruginibacter lapsinanis]